MPLLDLFWAFFWVFAWVMWFWLLFRVFGDLFRRDDVTGWGKAGWTILVLLLPFIGVLAYLITQGRAMADRDQRQARALQQHTDQYIRSVAGSGSSGVDEIARAKQLLDSGAITPAEFDQLKRKALV